MCAVKVWHNHEFGFVYKNISVQERKGISQRSNHEATENSLEAQMEKAVRTTTYSPENLKE